MAVKDLDNGQLMGAMMLLSTFTPDIQDKIRREWRKRARALHKPVKQKPGIINNERRGVHD